MISLFYCILNFPTFCYVFTVEKLVDFNLIVLQMYQWAMINFEKMFVKLKTRRQLLNHLLDLFQLYNYFVCSYTLF